MVSGCMGVDFGFFFPSFFPGYFSCILRTLIVSILGYRLLQFFSLLIRMYAWDFWRSVILFFSGGKVCIFFTCNGSYGFYLSG